VVDYTREDFTATSPGHDLLLDVAGSRPWAACRRVLTPRGRLVLAEAAGALRHLGEGHARGKLVVTV
jgi:NADPH:quinone reductase-like Zn-dependent oxidoreductase